MSSLRRRKDEQPIVPNIPSGEEGV